MNVFAVSLIERLRHSVLWIWAENVSLETLEDDNGVCQVQCFVPSKVLELHKYRNKKQSHHLLIATACTVHMDFATIPTFLD